MDRCDFYSPIQAPAMIILWPMFIITYFLRKL